MVVRNLLRAWASADCRRSSGASARAHHLTGAGSGPEYLEQFFGVRHILLRDGRSSKGIECDASAQAT